MVAPAGAALAVLGLLAAGSPLLSGASPVAEPAPPAAGGGASFPDTLPPWEVVGDPHSDDPVERGAYLARAGNCVVCHTEEDAPEEEFLAGGRAIETPFGTFYGTNITPHPEYGIGGWTEEDLARSLRQGVGPDGTHYYPVYPYPSFTGMTDEDVADLHAFLEAVPPVERENEPHDVRWFAFRGGLALWKRLNLEDERFEPDPARSEEWNRGAYLVRAVAHCAECHSPRTLTGAVDDDMRYAGTPEGGAGDESIPNITPAEETGIGEWTRRHFTRYLQIGMDPDGDFAGGTMADIIAEGTGHLTDEDREAIAEYLLSLEPVDHDF